MRAYNTYRHRRTIDIDMHVHKIQYAGPQYIKLRASLVNRFNGIVYETKIFKINRSDLPNWHQV